MDKAGPWTQRERLLYRIVMVLGALLIVGSLLFAALLVFSWGPAASHRLANLRVSPPPELTFSPSQGAFLEPTARSTPFDALDLVWVDTRSHVYHFPGSFWYGTTVQGKYLREENALAEGDRAALNERRPASFGVQAGR